MEDIEREREKRGKTMRFHYRAGRHFLKVTVPSRQHETICGDFFIDTAQKLFQMGLTKRNFRSVGSTTYHGTGSGDNGGSGQGDSAFVPQARCRSGQRWPTFILEVGYSQALEGLRNDMRWWFAASQYEVKIVLVAKLYQATQEIRLEKYVKDVSQVRTGATHTRNTPQLQPRLTQVVTITPREAGPGQELQFTVVGAPLILEFRHLFLRAPNLDAGERDLEYTSSDLEDTASAVWLSD
ncbi:hypothetical protein SEPCBS57363_001305 [Sporothrix epigloea]|uniref:Uncharacterized protein n=1 Tax=Sporothrix epigloea TaxID=1892477 RepID=A0ABP0D9I2_9PEZI